MKAKIWIRVHRNFEGEKEYLPQITFGVSTTMFGRECETVKEAIWHCEIMKSNLEGAGIDKRNIILRNRPSSKINCPIK